MKIKTLQDLSDNFEVLSHTEEKETLGGVDMISTADGYVYDLNITNLGFANSSFSDTDPINLGGSFSYVVDNGSGPVTINVNEGDWGSGVVGPDRFSLLYVGTDFNESFLGTKVYYDNVTGFSFSATFFRSMETGGGYDYESLPDITISDNNMGAFSGYTVFNNQLEKYLNYDELTGGYYDYSRIISTATHYDADYQGMIADGYAQQAINAQIAHDNATRADANDISGILGHINGSKLHAAQQAFAADPMNYGKPFDFAAYNQATMQQPILNISGMGPFNLGDLYSLWVETLNQFGITGTKGIMNPTP